MSGPIERGLRADLRKCGIKPASSTLAANALALAKRIDFGVENGTIEDKDLVSALRELRLTAAQILDQPPGDTKDKVSGFAGSAAGKL